MLSDRDFEGLLIIRQFNGIMKVNGGSSSICSLCLRYHLDDSLFFRQQMSAV